MYRLLVGISVDEYNMTKNITEELTEGITPDKLSENSGTGSGGGSRLWRPTLSSPAAGVGLVLAIKPDHEL